MTVSQKIGNAVSSKCYRVLNKLSGNRIRLPIACAYGNLRNAQEQYEDMIELNSVYGIDISEEQLKHAFDRINLYVSRARRRIESVEEEIRMLTVSQKIGNVIGAIHDDICILTDKRLSLGFRVLNALTRDRLRMSLVIALMNLKDAERWKDAVYGLESDGEPLTAEELKCALSMTMWYVSRARREIDSIWK